ncbi:MAG: BACON domain-containing protein [Bacteroidales bacterium]|nr:BACON domain-containing protein [Bacteroidales bacterium]
MKLNHILFVAAAVLAIASCKQPQPEVVSSVSVGTKSITASWEGETKTVALTANCEWTATSGAAWVTVTPASGNGATTLSLAIAENAGDARDGKVTVASKDGKANAEVLVSQAAKPGDQPTPGPEPAGNTIKTAAELSEFFGNAGTFTADDTWTIEADIDCGGATLAPAPSFAGVLDGKNHKIYNYNIVSNEPVAGLFLNISGTVKNVILGSSDGKKWDNSSSVSFGTEAANANHIGGVCAELTGTLENVKNFAKVSIVINNSEVSGIGGLVGRITSPATIKSCENGAQLEISGTMAQGAYTGGIVGHANNAEALLEDCVNSANLEFNIINAKYMMYGGIVGYIRDGAKVDKCRNEGDITYNNAEAGGTYIMIAGICGGMYYNSTVSNCVNKGKISTNRNQVSRIGGIVGTLNSKGVVEGNTNEGEVVINHDFENGNWQAAGGIVGFQEKESADNIIRNNTNKGAVTVVVENATTHANKVTAGGILGLGVLGLEISGNVNEAAVSITNKAAGPAYAGGIAGWFKGAGTFTKNNENKGAVNCKTSDDAASVAGGVVGCVNDKVGTCTSDKNTGAVVCANAAAAGSIAGTNNGKLVNCVAGGSVNGTKLTDANLAGLTQGTSSAGTAEGTTLAK